MTEPFYHLPFSLACPLVLAIGAVLGALLRRLRLPAVPARGPSGPLPFTAQEEIRASEHARRVWIRYREAGGNTREGTIEIYHPAADADHVLAWCCTAQRPGVFRRDAITAWLVLPERFEVNPLVAQYLREGWHRPGEQHIPWDRWKAARLY